MEPCLPTPPLYRMTTGAIMAFTTRHRAQGITMRYGWPLTAEGFRRDKATGSLFSGSMLKKGSSVAAGETALKSMCAIVRIKVQIPAPL